MFGDRLMGFPGDFNPGRASDHRFSDLGPEGFLPSTETNPFLMNHHSYNKNSTTLDLCKKLKQMGIVCDMSIWTEPEPFRVDPASRTTLDHLGGASRSFDGFCNVSSSRRNDSPGELRFLGLQDSLNPTGFREMILPRRDFLNRPINPSPPCLRGSLMFEGKSAFQGSRELGASYLEDTLIGQDSYFKMTPNNINDAFMGSLKFRGKPNMEGYLENTLMGQGSTTGLPLSLNSIVKIYGSVNLMARDQVGCRVLQKLMDQGDFRESKVIFHEIIGDVIELSIDPFGNYFVQKLMDVCTEEQRTLMVTVLTSRPTDLIKICLNTYGTRVVQRMIETVQTKQQIELVKSGLKPGFLALVKDLNGNHVIQTCLLTFGPNDNKFVLEAATKYCAQIATHRHGCCVLQCCILNSVGAQRDRLVAEISRNSLHLSQDPFGNYVVQYIIEQQVPAVKLLMQLRTHYAELATQKFSSHVVEKCLRHYPESRSEIIRELLNVPNFEHLLQDPFANYVIQTALSVSKGAARERLVARVYKFGSLRSSPYCKKIFSKTILRK